MSDDDVKTYSKFENFDYNKRLEQMEKGLCEYNEWLTVEEWKKYMALIHHKKWSKEDIDILIEVTKQMLKILWVKQRFPAWHCKQFEYIQKFITMEASNLVFLKDIKANKRPIEDIIHIFPK